eukprot:CAMPEP_0174725768 /NCGR_PEP_ID=MMETSP1094-20130205/46377_1 /TAXON_ID=156173 /ORGANISM="Chrysochromulina brevifilum, Strain UTEX LB 985" /LENGTH=100 /DNA_ID=CAMNT_0015927243 /DNA_START=129 /DNA_END=427 /DNA_ORIENTATION=+
MAPDDSIAPVVQPESSPPAHKQVAGTPSYMASTTIAQTSLYTETCAVAARHRHMHAPPRPPAAHEHSTHAPLKSSTAPPIRPMHATRSMHRCASMCVART